MIGVWLWPVASCAFCAAVDWPGNRFDFMKYVSLLFIIVSRRENGIAT